MMIGTIDGVLTDMVKRIASPTLKIVAAKAPAGSTIKTMAAQVAEIYKPPPVPPPPLAPAEAYPGYPSMAIRPGGDLAKYAAIAVAGAAGIFLIRAIMKRRQQA